MDPYTNFAYGTVKAGSTIIGSASSPRTIVVDDGSVFPGGDGSTEFDVVVWPSRTQPTKDNAEIITCTRSGNTLTAVARGAQSTVALTTILAGYQVGQHLTKGFIDDLRAEEIGKRLDYSQITADVTGITATTEGTAQMVINGNSVVYDGGRVRVEICLKWLLAVSGIGSGLTLVLLRDTTVLGQSFVNAAALAASLCDAFYDTPPAGAHTYKLKAFGNGTLNWTVKAGPGGSGQLLPAFLLVTRDQ